MKKFTIRQNELTGFYFTHPERTGYRFATRDIGSDLLVQEWPNRAALRKTIEMQEKRERDILDWRMVQK